MAHIQAVPKQSSKVYKLLNESGELTAKQIAERLGILPNAVYRAINPLIELGMAERTTAYPISFKASPTADAMNWYLRAAAQSFRKDFGTIRAGQSDNSVPSITFIKDRKQLLELGELEALKAKKTIDYIVSGHRIPESTQLAFRKASTIGVKIRCIVQNKPGTTNTDIDMFHDMGADVRYLPNIGIRLFVYDNKTAVLVSYDETQSSRAFGIRFTYSPVAKQLSELFEQRWLEAELLD